eukprot:m.111349 g.111349  ORF g.111349 m.111349 type:complete len:97 (+) comp13443_c1_seq1:1225-1515(+)
MAPVLFRFSSSQRMVQSTGYTLCLIAYIIWLLRTSGQIQTTAQTLKSSLGTVLVLCESIHRSRSAATVQQHHLVLVALLAIRLIGSYISSQSAQRF